MSKNIDPASSLDLLLDTICNTFGGIIFIAILTAILLQLSGKAATQAPIAPAEADPLQQASAAAERDSLERALRQQDALLGRFDVDTARQELLQLQSVQQSNDRLSADNHARAAEIDRLQAEGDQAARHAAADEKQLAVAIARIAQLEQQAEKEKKAHSREARLPRLHGTRKREVPLFLVQNRISLLIQPNRLRSINHDDFDVADEGAGHAIRPKPGHGTAIADEKQSREQLGELIAGFDKDNEYLAVFVTPDSFEVFGAVRSVMIEKGFEYRLVPLEKVETLHEGTGPGLVQ